MSRKNRRSRSRGGKRAKPPTVGLSKGKAPSILRKPRSKPSKPRADKRQGGAKFFSDTYTPTVVVEGDLHDKARGALLWSVYGDSCGMPFETKAPLDIFARNGGWVEGLTSPKNGFKEYLDKGGWTDDTQLKIAIMESILEMNGIDMDSIGEHHARQWDLGPRGWGGSTRSSVQRLKSGASWRNSGKMGGAGNGIPMKIGPIGVYYGVRYSESLQGGSWRSGDLNLYAEMARDCRDLAIMTHMDSRAIIAGFVHAVLVAWALKGVDPLENWDDLMRMVEKLESIFPNEDILMSDRMGWIEPNLHRDIEFFAHLYRTGCFVVESYPFSVAAYLLYRQDVVGGILATVNCGGDCDSTGAMVGELCGAEAGLGTEDRTLELEEHDQLLGLADAFYRNCRG